MSGRPLRTAGQPPHRGWRTGRPASGSSLAATPFSPRHPGTVGLLTLSRRWPQRARLRTWPATCDRRGRPLGGFARQWWRWCVWWGIVNPMAADRPLLERIRAIRDRRRPGDATPVRAASGHLRRLHRVRAGAWPSSRTSSATRFCRATPTPIPNPAAPGCRPPGCAKTPAIIRNSVGGDDETVVIFAGSGCTGAIDKLVGILGLRIPAALEDRYRLSDAIPAERAAGRLHRAVRASFQRTALAVSRSPTSS